MSFNNSPKTVFISSTISDENMSFKYDTLEKASNNRSRFFKGNKIDKQKVAEVLQVHSTETLKVDNRNIEQLKTQNADGMITNVPGIYLAIKSADCHQIGFFDPKNEAIGLVHAGWQGLDKGILKNVVKKMNQEFGTDPKYLLVKFGPSIGPCCYKGLIDLKQKDDPKWKPYIFQDEQGTYELDIWKFAEDQLVNLNVKKENIDNPKICTYHTNTYFSHRRSILGGTPESRFITIIGIKI